MQPQGRPQEQKDKARVLLQDSYSQLLDEFSSSDLRTVGNYTLGRLIGKGSFGKVYLATHKLTNGSKVVLKSAKKDDANLAREIHHHRQFIHPHIARLYEVIVTESLVWLVLEYCSGDELYNHLLKTGPIEPAKVQKIFTQLVGAVSYVHQKSCVHRDLKLENILLDKHENVKLVDFGFTREYEGKQSYLQTWCGTICYSAPEMLKGEKYAGEKVDVWSLGIILYALLCGELPWDEDDEDATKKRILKEEPKYPDHLPEQAKDLISKLLSKRPLLRPTLADILQHPWLAEHAPQQQVILKLQQPAPFTTELEKETLQRMRSAGVDIDMVIENVLAQRCDSLAGWWALLIEKEERKAKKRDRKRKEREAEAKTLRRLSAASSRLERIAPTIHESKEEAHYGTHGLQVPVLGDPPRGRPHQIKRKSLQAHSELPQLPEGSSSPKSPLPPPPVEKDSIRSADSSRARPPPPPKENGINSSSKIHLVQQSPEAAVATPNGAPPPDRRKKYHYPLLSQLASIKHWIKESAKRSKSPQRGKPQHPTPGLATSGPRTATSRRLSTASSTAYRYSNSHLRSDLTTRAGYPQRPMISTNPSTPGGSASKRPSLSPGPLTPHSSYRRSSAGLRGRKSTSSSVSSVRSIHHHHSHSKASSTSSQSTSLASPTASTSIKLGRSPHSSVKVLPATPTTSSFPSNIRVVRATAIGSEGSAAFSALPPPPSPGLIFARRKRSVFKGPLLSVAGFGSNSIAGRARGDAGSRRNSAQGSRRSGETIKEEDEEEDEVEEVEDFTPGGLHSGHDDILDFPPAQAGAEQEGLSERA